MKKIVLFLILFLVCSCTTIHEHGHFSVISNQPVDLKDFSIVKKAPTERIEGARFGKTFLFIPTHPISTVDEALDDAMNKMDKEQNLLINADLKYRHFWAPFYLSQGFMVSGDSAKSTY